MLRDPVLTEPCRSSPFAAHDVLILPYHLQFGRTRASEISQITELLLLYFDFDLGLIVWCRSCSVHSSATFRKTLAGHKTRQGVFQMLTF